MEEKSNPPNYPVTTTPTEAPWLMVLFICGMLILVFGYTGDWFWLGAIAVVVCLFGGATAWDKYKAPRITVTDTEIIVEARMGKYKQVYKRKHISHWEETYVRVHKGTDYHQLTCYSTIADFVLLSRDVGNYDELKAAILYKLPGGVKLEVVA